MRSSALNIIGVAVFLFCLVSVSGAQQSTIQMDDGITVAIKTVSRSGDDADTSYGNIYSTQSAGRVHRVMTDRKNKIYFGYDLVVERQPDSGKFRVSIGPLTKSPDSLIGRPAARVGTGESRGSGVSVGSGSSDATRGSVGSRESGKTNYSDYSPESLQSYPEPVVIDDGDSISIDILENPVTGTKITDVIKISYRSGQFGAIYSADDSARDFSLDEVLLRMETPDVVVNSERFETRSSVAGNIIWIYIPGKGRFIFSFLPQTGFPFRKTGTIDDNKIFFEHEGDRFMIVSKSTILAYGGKWNMWMMHDSWYGRRKDEPDNPSFEFGGASSVDLLFRSTGTNKL